MWRKMFSSTTTELSISREKASASPPRTMVLTVPPRAQIAKKRCQCRERNRKEDGRRSRACCRGTAGSSAPVSTKPIPPSCSRFSMAFFTKMDWSNTTLATSCFRNVSKISNRVLDAVHDRDGVGIAALLQHRQIDRWLAVHAHDIGLNLVRIQRLADVLHQHRRVAHGLQGKAVDFSRVWQLAVGVEVVVNRPDLHITGRQNQVAVIDSSGCQRAAPVLRAKTSRGNWDSENEQQRRPRKHRRRTRSHKQDGASRNAAQAAPAPSIGLSTRSAGTSPS